MDFGGDTSIQITALGKYSITPQGPDHEAFILVLCLRKDTSKTWYWLLALTGGELLVLG